MLTLLTEPEVQFREKPVRDNQDLPSLNRNWGGSLNDGQGLQVGYADRRAYLKTKFFSDDLQQDKIHCWLQDRDNDRILVGSKSKSTLKQNLTIYVERQKRREDGREIEGHGNDMIFARLVFWQNAGAQVTLLVKGQPHNGEADARLTERRKTVCSGSDLYLVEKNSPAGRKGRELADTFVWQGCC